MTDYGRGRGPEPWDPEDPLYGDQGWGAQQAEDGRPPYDAQAQQQQPQHPQQQQYDPQYGGGGWETGQQQYVQQQPQQPQQPQHPQQQQYDPQYGGGGWDTGQQQYVQQQPQQQHQQPQQQYDQQYPDQQQYDQHYPDQGYGNQQQYAARPDDPSYGGGWDTGRQAAVPGGTHPGDPYAGGPADGYAGGNPDPYSTPQQQQQPPARPQERRRPAPPVAEPESDWDGPQPEETHPFFTGADGGDGDDDRRERGARDGRRRRERDDEPDEPEYDDEDESRRGGGGRDRRGASKKKRRGGSACLVASLVLVAGTAGGGYYAYQFWQERFGPAPDFAGAGAGAVQVEIPQGAGLAEMGGLLRDAGVVKSAQAFIDAAGEHPKGEAIQPGVYPLKKEMSAKAAVELMTNPANLNSLTIREGIRAVQVYEFIDEKLKVKPGTTAAVAKEEADSLGLPEWADDGEDSDRIKDPLEGFLYPARYEIGEKTKPEDILKKMVARANQEYEKHDLEASAEELGLDSPLDVITVASLVQAEGITHDDFKKMAAVVYNRLKPTNTDTNQKLEFDSTFNYLKNQSEIDISTSEIRNFDDRYNTYFYKGLPPGPIGNPGADAINATMAPDTGAWMFFISIDGKTTQFTKTLAEHEKLVAEFNERRKNADD
ncbi:endolytic transglycosylase MltG [Streptomyces sp. NBC_01498]|uniref:endolytic transglycosylase MltG n=1 Tax=Streptomyces sp. NBC_01498 TaxID=2975870 RepID=UPI002E7C20BA|nr:endolytic transglycosylase MltG [Streptomyces sp. NBC_01498]WTL27853.1 endolytic transglycosylase MltG [Streptomyces sp. NBC_01498]